MSRFEETEMGIDGVYTISKKVIGDERGYLERIYCASELNCWSNRRIAQVNRTFTATRGTVRGLHFQKKPYAEAKLICCLRGKVMDYALDLRISSETYGKIFTVELDAAAHNAVLLPEGIAHGFQSLTDNVEMLYFHSQPYNPNYEAGVNILDPFLDINLPLSCPVMSNRDKQFPSFHELKAVYP